jgi:hypothetical protein
METLTGKRQFLDALIGEGAWWEDLLAQVGEERMERDGVTGEWAVKDIIAHVSAWEGRSVAWLNALQAETTPQPPPWPANETEENINAWIFNANRHRSLPEVLAESRRSFDQVLEGVESAPDEALSKRYAWLNRRTMLDALPGNTYEHYREHGELIRSWLAQA